MASIKFILICTGCAALAGCASMTPEQGAAVGATVVGTGLTAWQSIVDILGAKGVLSPEQVASMHAGLGNVTNTVDAVTQVTGVLANAITSMRDQIMHVGQQALEAKQAASGSVTPTEALTGLGVVATAAEAARRAHKAGKASKT